MKVRILTLGDSHSLYSFAGVAEARIFWRGPITMHRAARDGIASLVPGNFKPKKGDFVVLSFGEIDCRAHIKKQADIKGTSTLEEVDKLCKRFEKAVADFSSKCAAQVCIACVVPFNPDFLEHDRYTHSDDCWQDAKAIRERMNSNLSSMEVPFIDFHSAFANADGSIVPEMSDGNLHIDSRCSEPVLSALKDALGTNFTSRRPPWPNPKTLVEPAYISPGSRAYGLVKALGGVLRRWTRPIRRSGKSRENRSGSGL